MSGFTQFMQGLEKLQKIRNDMSEVELREAILNLRQQGLEAQNELIEVKAENLTLKQELEDLRSAKERASKLKEVTGYKYETDDAGEAIGLPFCPICEVKEQKLYRLIKQNDQYSRCKNCDNSFPAASDGRVHEEVPPVNLSSGGTFF